jgi:hypothetical protein
VSRGWRGRLRTGFGGITLFVLRFRRRRRMGVVVGWVVFLVCTVRWTSIGCLRLVRLTLRCGRLGIRGRITSVGRRRVLGSSFCWTRTCRGKAMGTKLRLCLSAPEQRFAWLYSQSQRTPDDIRHCFYEAFNCPDLKPEHALYRGTQVLQQARVAAEIKRIDGAAEADRAALEEAKEKLGLDEVAAQFRLREEFWLWCITAVQKAREITKRVGVSTAQTKAMELVAKALGIIGEGGIVKIVQQGDPKQAQEAIAVWRGMLEKAGLKADRKSEKDEQARPTGTE